MESENWITSHSMVCGREEEILNSWVQLKVSSSQPESFVFRKYAFYFLTITTVQINLAEERKFVHFEDIIQTFSHEQTTFEFCAV